jgi:hypothetical protein
MQNNNYQTKHPRGSSPPFQEMESELDNWISRLPSIKPISTCTQGGEEKRAVDDSVPGLFLIK